jgi:hypothetical protein
MSDWHCTTDAYGNTGCIGTAVHTHSTIGSLPMTGFGVGFALYVAVVVVVCGITLRLRGGVS